MSKLTTQQAEKIVARDSRRKAETKSKTQGMKAKLALSFGGLGAVFVHSLAEQKFPRMATFTDGGSVPTAPFIGGGLLLAGLGSKSAGVLGAGLSITSKFLGDWDQNQSWAQPK